MHTNGQITRSPAVRVLFVNGFHRSGTTLVTAAATEASHGVTLTVGHLARHLPHLDEFLGTAVAPRADQGVDRGVDRLPVTRATPEEYGWLLHHATGQHSFRVETARSGVLQDLVGELVRDSGASVVVLKNPWDTGQELRLLHHFDGSQVLLLRRTLAAIEDSAERALLRYLTANQYLRALTGDDTTVEKLLDALTNPRSRAVLMFLSRWRLRVNVLRLVRRVSKLPLDRVAFLCYDELRDDPQTGSLWARHLIDPDGFARSFAKLSFPEHPPRRDGAWVTRVIDRYWAWAWRRMRAAQVNAGLLAPAGATDTG